MPYFLVYLQLALKFCCHLNIYLPLLANSHYWIDHNSMTNYGLGERWRFVAKVDSITAIRRQHMVYKSEANGNKVWFRCLTRKKRHNKGTHSREEETVTREENSEVPNTATTTVNIFAPKKKHWKYCPYSMLWNRKTSELRRKPMCILPMLTLHIQLAQMPASYRKWRSVRKAKSIDEINERYKVYSRTKSKGMHWFECKLYQHQKQRCQFQVRWNVQSGQVWESGEHNHGPEKYSKDIRKRREWHYLAKADSFLLIRRQYLVRKTCDWDNYIGFQCIANSKTMQKTCPYALRWNHQTGELYESGTHDHTGLPAIKLQIPMEWKLLKGKLIKSLAEVRRRYPVNKFGNSNKKNIPRSWFKCCHCDGQKCDYTLRWNRNDGTIFWNKKQPCRRSKKTGDTPSPELQFVDALNRDHKCHLRPMKLEAVGSQQCKKFQILLPLLTIKEETGETQSQAWHPNLKTVKKEEPNEAEEPAADFVEENVIDNGRKEAADQAPTKMLLRERKRQPNYAGLDGKEMKKALRRRGTKN